MNFEFGRSIRLVENMLVCRCGLFAALVKKTSSTLSRQQTTFEDPDGNYTGQGGSAPRPLPCWCHVCGLPASTVYWCMASNRKAFRNLFLNEDNPFMVGSDCYIYTYNHSQLNQTVIRSLYLSFMDLSLDFPSIECLEIKISKLGWYISQLSITVYI